jgi:hypothetical protein
MNKFKKYSRVALNILIGTITMYGILAVVTLIAFVGIPLAAVGQGMYNLKNIKRGEQ